MTPEVIDAPQLRVAAVRHVGPYPEIGRAFARLEEIIAGAGMLEGGATLVAIFHDNPATVPAAELRSDAGVVLPAGATVPPGLAVVVLPAGKHLRGRHVGPYSGLPGAWAVVRDAVLADHRRGDGPGYELYLNNPNNARPEDLVTEIHIPLA